LLDLNLLDFSIFPILQVKVQVAPHDNQDALRPFSPQNVHIHPQGLPLIPLLPGCRYVKSANFIE
jgi:hypothetical protein